MFKPVFYKPLPGVGLIPADLSLVAAPWAGFSVPSRGSLSKWSSRVICQSFRLGLLAGAAALGGDALGGDCGGGGARVLGELLAVGSEEAALGGDALGDGLGDALVAALGGDLGAAPPLENVLGGIAPPEDPDPLGAAPPPEGPEVTGATPWLCWLSLGGIAPWLGLNGAASPAGAINGVLAGLRYPWAAATCASTLCRAASCRRWLTVSIP